MKCTKRTLKRHNNPLTWVMFVILLWLLYPLFVPDVQNGQQDYEIKGK